MDEQIEVNGIKYAPAEVIRLIEKARTCEQIHNDQANGTINELQRTLRNAMVWGGMDWHYNPLHPMYVKKCLDLITQYHQSKITKVCGDA